MWERRSDLVVTVTKTITKSNCASFTVTQTITKTKSKSNTKTILKLNQITEYYIKTVTETMLKLKRFSMVNMFTRLECTTLHYIIVRMCVSPKTSGHQSSRRQTNSATTNSATRVSQLGDSLFRLSVCFVLIEQTSWARKPCYRNRETMQCCC